MQRCEGHTSLHPFELHQSIINVIIGILKKICAYEMLIMTRIFGIHFIQCIFALVAFELAKIGGGGGVSNPNPSNLSAYISYI